MRLLTYILAILLFLPVKARGEAIDTPVEPLLLYKAKQDVRCQQWVDSIMNKLTLKEKVGQLFIYTIAPVDTKRNQIPSIPIKSADCCFPVGRCRPRRN